MILEIYLKYFARHKFRFTSKTNSKQVSRHKQDMTNREKYYLRKCLLTEGLLVLAFCSKQEHVSLKYLLLNCCLYIPAPQSQDLPICRKVFSICNYTLKNRFLLKYLK